MRHGKYNARKTTVDGVTFASAREAARYGELKMLERAGKISGLELQPRYELQPAFRTKDGKAIRAVEYVADFVYTEDGKIIIEDCKGWRTDIFKLKLKLMFFRHPDINFRLT